MKKKDLINEFKKIEVTEQELLDNNIKLQEDQYVLKIEDYWLKVSLKDYERNIVFTKKIDLKEKNSNKENEKYDGYGKTGKRNYFDKDSVSNFLSLIEKNIPFTICSSNKDKLKEYQSIMPNTLIKKIKDMREVDSNSFDVIKYKIKDNKELGLKEIVEDTILILEGKEVVDIKYKLKEIIENVKESDFICIQDVNKVDEFIYYINGEEVKRSKMFEKELVYKNKTFIFEKIFLALDSLKNSLIEKNENNMTLFEDKSIINLIIEENKIKVHKCKKIIADWQIIAGFKDINNKIILNVATMNGYINPFKYKENTFGFDSVFIPTDMFVIKSPNEETINPKKKTLYELDLNNEKDKYNPRLMIANKFLNHNVFLEYKIEDIPKWDGKYQKQTKIKEKNKKVQLVS